MIGQQLKRQLFGIRKPENYEVLCLDRFCMYKNISDSMLYLNNKKHEQIKYLKYALMYV